ncbi:hypothetical protein FGG08_000243 [Glutinoglossum americanum]|uniref:Rho-GAP domain-containing protein n=1 Tax=Glutinoglossum americanum TaxID=1670608 RepID=A0A9P8L656_9PEZI|nr:hypothetical protein FGG08_000243 [Glutinoglossum americanum]
MNYTKDSPIFGRDSCQHRDEPRYRRSRLRASLSVSSTLRKIATDVDSPPAAPEPADLRITQGLLSEGTLATSSRRNTRAMSQRGDALTPSLYRDRRTSAASAQTGGSQGHSRITSTTWSTVSNRVFTNSSRSSERDPLEFLAEYNRLGSKHGLPKLFYESPSAVIAGTTIHSGQPPVSWLLRKLLRKTSSVQTMRHPSNQRLTHDSSILDIALTDRGRKDILKDRALEDIARLGGESIKTPGIFRVSGSSTSTNALYDHYSRQFLEAEKSVQLVHQTISSGQIPNHISCNIHDVASVFKKFLIGLPGGILGSIPLFKALRDIHTALFPSPDLPESHQRKVEARLIALAVASLGSEHSMALICAVFGLLNLVGYEAENTRTADGEGRVPAAKDMMGYEALGVVFGPLLLGRKMELVELHSEDDRGGLLVIPESPNRRRGSRRKKDAVKVTSNNVKRQVGEARMAAGVAEMLARSWKDVVRQLRNIGAVDIAPLSEAPEGDAVVKDVDAAAIGDSEFPLQERKLNNFRSAAEVAENQSRRKLQTHSIGDTTAADFRTFSNSDAHSISPPRLQAQPRTGLDSNDESILGSAVLDNSIEIEISDCLPFAGSLGQQLRHPWVSEIVQDPISAARSQPVPMHRTGSAGETIRYEQMGPGKISSIDLDRETTETPIPGCPMVETIGRDDREGSLDPCGQHASTNDLRVHTNQTRLGEGENSQAISLLKVNGSDPLVEGMSARTRDTIGGQGPRGPNDLDAQSISPHGAPGRESSPHPGTDTGDKLFPQPTCLDDVPLRAEHEDRVRYSLSDNQFQRDISANFCSAEFDAPQVPEWLFDMSKATLSKESESITALKNQQQKLGNGPQPYAGTSVRGIDSVFNATPGNQSALLTLGASHNTEAVETNSTTPSSSVKSQNNPQSFDVLSDQDVPARSSSMSQAVAKCPPSVKTSLVRHRSEAPIRKLGTASADRLDRLLPPAEEPEVARHISWRNSSELGTSRTSSEQGLTPILSQKGNATLYAEIRRLQRLIDLRTEEAVQAQRELEAMRKFKDSGTLSEKLREAQRDLKTWKNRAEWAEKRLLMQDAERRGAAPTRKEEDVVPIRGSRRTTKLERATMM